MMTKDRKKLGNSFLRTVSHWMKRNRLGQNLVRSGVISIGELRKALRLQRNTHQPLGAILIQQHAVTRSQVSRALIRQNILRGVFALMMVLASVSNIKKARAGGDIRDVPARISIAQDFKKASFAPVAGYPGLMGSTEKASRNLSAFTKWSGMFARFERQLSDAHTQDIIRQWQDNLRDIQSTSLKAMADRVNDLVNEKRYIVDSKNWGQSDYWATPAEFLENGGDCEDFAIAKYTALRMMGVPEERLRVAIVHDTQKNIPHAVLVVYTEQGAYILDNQIKRLVDAERPGRYRPIYSINRHAWWLHTKPSSATVIASAN